MRYRNGLFAVVAVATCLFSSAASGKGFESSLDPPHWAAKSLAATGIEEWPGSLGGAVYTVSRHLSPNSVVADFDGDGKDDLAILVRRKTDDRFGIAIVLRAGAKKAEKAFIVGAGEKFGSGGLDFRWMDSWSVLDHERMSANAQKVGPKGQGLVLQKRDAAAGSIVYDGSKFVWVAQN